MTDEESCKMLEKFINDHVLATEIKVEVTHHYKSFNPRYEGAKSHYEDANLLASILTGAESFLYWVRRNNYTISKGGLDGAKSKTKKKKSK
jgi:hypothetical protein